MVVKLQESDGVKVYNITADKVLPAWVQKKKGSNLSRDAEYAKHVDLMQDFGFPSACHHVKATADGQYIFASGVHAPRVRVYDVNNLALKFERHFDSEIVDFQVLTEDYSKCVFLTADRAVTFHTRMGKHFATRVPKAGRDLAYLPNLAELVVAGSSSDIWRINLYEGRFMTPLATSSAAVNALGVCPSHGLLAAAGQGGCLECFDSRAMGSLGAANAAAAMGFPGEDMTALRFDASGLYLAAGTSGGKVGVFDLRKALPLTVKDHMYDAPIVDIKFHTAAGDHTGLQRVISADCHIVKVWDMHSGAGFTSVEPNCGDINDVCVWPGSGLTFVATDSPHIGIYFTPSLGPAPAWCNFLESVVEDMTASEASGSVYDDYRFVTKDDLVRLELDHLLGTHLVRAYMHGYFIDNRLYHKAHARVAPFEYEAFRAKRVAEKLEAERLSRISMVRKLPKVNAEEHVRLQAASMAAAESSRKQMQQDGAAAEELLQDNRFAAMFEDTDFAIDTSSKVYRELHPNAVHRKKTAAESLIEEHFKAAGASGSDAGASDTDASESEDETAVQHRKRRMLAARDEASGDLFARRESVAVVRERMLGERVQEEGGEERRRASGNRDVSFQPRSGSSRGGSDSKHERSASKGGTADGELSGGRGRGRRSGRGHGPPGKGANRAGGRGGGGGGRGQGRGGGSGRGRGSGGGRSRGRGR